MGWQDAPVQAKGGWQSAPVAGDFETQLQGMTPDQIYVAQRQNTPMGEYLRNKAMQPREGESDSDRFRRLYGGPEAIPTAEGVARGVSQGLSFARGDEIAAGLMAAGDYAMDLTPGAPSLGELYSGYKNRENQKLEQFRREKPITATASEIAGAIPTALAIPTAGAGANLPVLTRMLLGMGQGAAEAGVYGYNAGTGDQVDRLKNAAITGGVGAGVGMLAPALGAGVNALINRGLWNSAAKQAGMDPAAYKVLTRTVDADRINPTAIGPDTALVDVAPRGNRLLDLAAQTTGPQARIVEDAVTGRVNDATQRINQAMDTTLGQPQGVRQSARDIASSTATTRRDAYETAYGKPINYASPEGRAVEDALARVDSKTLSAAIEEANADMLANNVRNQQIMASVSPDGTVTFREMPNVQQVDYIKRALQNMGRETDQFGRKTPKAQRAGNLARLVRDALDNAVPEYGAATAAGADKIARDQALDIGYRALRASTTRETVAEAMEGASAAERSAAAQGLRSFLDDTLANVKAAFTDPNLDAKEAAKALKDLTTRAARDKVETILGQRAASQFYQELDATFPAFALKAGISQSSKTAPREILNEELKSITDDGVINAFRSGEPLNFGKRTWQAVMGRTADDKVRVNDETLQQIANGLLSRGDDARRLVEMMNLSAQNIPPRMDQMGRLTRLLFKGTATGTTAPMVQR